MFNERKFFPSNQRIVDNAKSMYPSKSLPGLKNLVILDFSPMEWSTGKPAISDMAITNQN
jgi:hypothetical protein